MQRRGSFDSRATADSQHGRMATFMPV